MSIKRKWIVRVAVSEKELAGGRLLLEHLRHAGVVKLHVPGSTLPDTSVFDIRCPAGLNDDKTWAESNARRISSFLGWNAAAVLEGTVVS
jgi:hypothetical protein